MCYSKGTSGPRRLPRRHDILGSGRILFLATPWPPDPTGTSCTGRRQPPAFTSSSLTWWLSTKGPKIFLISPFIKGQPPPGRRPPSLFAPPGLAQSPTQQQCQEPGVPSPPPHVTIPVRTETRPRVYVCLLRGWLG